MQTNTKFLSQLILKSFFALIVSAVGVSAATFTVTNTNDSGTGSLRQAILSANAAAGADTIVFDSSFNVPQTITMASSEMLIDSVGGNLTINGPGRDLLTVSGNDQFRVFQINSVAAAVSVEMNNFTIIKGGLTSAAQFAGSSIAINSAGNIPPGHLLANLTLNNVAITNNTQTIGGYNIYCRNNCNLNINNSYIGNNRVAAINHVSSLTPNSLVISNSTIENNVSGADGLVVATGLNVTVTNSTISDNVVGNNGIFRVTLDPNDTLNMTNTTIAGNSGGIGSAIGLSAGGLSFTAIANLTNVTIANNYSGSSNTSAGITSASGTATWNIKNSIIANNHNSAGKADFYLNSLNHQLNISYSLVESVWNPSSGTQSHPVPVANGNLPGIDPWLDGVLRNYGSATKTLALRRGSPAIDSGDPTTFPATDQRGIMRPQDGNGDGNARSDMGAFEKRAIDIPATDKTDLDGDGKADIGIFRPMGGEWWYLRSSDGGNSALQFGSSTDKIVPADYTGDGKADIAFFRPSSGQWFILRSDNLSFYAFPFGTNGDTPVPADYDGDGKVDAAVFRSSNSAWYIQKSSGGTDIFTFGISGDKPVVSDYDGDGKADVAIYRPNGSTGGEWWIRRSSNGSVFSVSFGTSTDRPVQGDYTGDGKSDIAFYRPSSGQWFILRSEDFSFYGFPFGASGDVPVAGDYDGDGIYDAAVFRSSNVGWYIQRSTSGTTSLQFGISSDIPLATAYLP